MTIAKKKSSQWIHKFLDHIYEAEIWFFHQGSPKDMEDYLRKTLDRTLVVDCHNGHDGWVTTLANETTGRSIYVVWIKGVNDFVCLNHECFHLTCRIFRDRRVLLDFSVGGQEEHFAYYQDSLIRGLGALMKRSWKKAKKK